ncbi:MAG TPA: hypothetical protein VG898_11860 [Solirubrobacterales bacterium]|nr:hypothetical protein [Solirubrobacterales bacterium]
MSAVRNRIGGGGLELMFVIVAAMLFAAAPARAGDFSFVPGSVDGGVFTTGGAAYTQAGGHPDEGSVNFELTREPNGFNGGGGAPSFVPGGALRNVTADIPPGLIGNPSAVPVCDNLTLVSKHLCPADTQVGIATVLTGSIISGECCAPFATPVYAVKPSYGVAALFAFAIISNVVTLNGGIRSDGDYGVTIEVKNASQALVVGGSKVTFWGNPADPSHDGERFGPGCDSGCPSSIQPRAFLTNPTTCTAPGEGLSTGVTVEAWDGRKISDSFISHEPPGYPTAPALWGPPIGPTDCDVVPFNPRIKAQTTTDHAKTASGLDFELEFPTDGLSNPSGISQSQPKKTVVRLPEGVTINPASAEGLGVCTPADYAREKVATVQGDGCPNGSRLGTVAIDTPLLGEQLTGSLYLAQQDDPSTSTPGAENPFDSLLALYIVAKIPDRGVIVKLAGKVEPDPKTGQLVTTFDDLPQLPFSRFKLHFREGQRAPLVSPPACGTYTTEAEFVPWSAADPDNPTRQEVKTATAKFQVTHGVSNDPCPSGGLPPFHPGLIAGSINNRAGSFSPFNVRLTRSDGEQEFTHFSIKLPPGIVGKLAGIPFCPDAAIEAAKAKTGAGELASPSCPAASQVGRTLVGAGVGSVQTYVGGKVYLAGPYHGSALSIAAITAAKVGPFDVGTVVVREALKIDPETAEVFVDATGSDPLPHIIDGITTHLRDIRVYVDRNQFVLNPTDCTPTSTASTVLGSGLDFASAVDDNPITVSSPFQAADCAALPFKPKLTLSLKGGTRRGAHPALKAFLRMNGIGEAGVGRAQVTLPKSEFIENAHFKTICTRVQFKEAGGNGEACPAGSIYGFARAKTPLLDKPLEGPIFLRSSEHQLPDVVASLRGQEINVHLVGHVDSVKGRLRNTFETVPDAPVEWASFSFQGAKKGLFVNSTNLCRRKNRADVRFTGQNGKLHNYRPAVKAACGKKHKHPRHKRAAR